MRTLLLAAVAATLLASTPHHAHADMLEQWDIEDLQDSIDDLQASVDGTNHAQSARYPNYYYQYYGCASHGLELGKAWKDIAAHCENFIVSRFHLSANPVIDLCAIPIPRKYRIASVTRFCAG
jgi:hypothetical protein